jgi:hypothetical protein
MAVDERNNAKREAHGANGRPAPKALSEAPRPPARHLPKSNPANPPSVEQRRGEVVGIVATAKRSIQIDQEQDKDGRPARAIDRREAAVLARALLDLVAYGHARFSHVSDGMLRKVLDDPRFTEPSAMAAKLSLDCGAFGDVRGRSESEEDAVVRVGAHYEKSVRA